MKSFCNWMLGITLSFTLACDKGKSDKNTKQAQESQKTKTPNRENPSLSEHGFSGRKFSDKTSPSKDAKGDGLLENALERRLYSDDIEASSFLWVNYNRFQENYHAKYLMDGDPVTTWIEGAEGDGHGEWVRIHTSKVEKATTLRLRLRNGYHKTEALFKKNARVKEMRLHVLPGGISKTVVLADNMDWAEIEVPLAGGAFEGVELEIGSTYPGTKYRDTCISDVEIYVTGHTADNPAYEAKKLAKIREWKAERLEAAKVFSSASAGALPIRNGYRVKAGPAVSLKKLEGNHRVARAAVGELGPHAKGQERLFVRARSSLGGDFLGWTPYRIAVRKPIVLPAVDGLTNSKVGSTSWPHDAFVIPHLKRKSLVNAKSIALFEGKSEDFDREDSECDPGTVWAMRPDEEGPTARELLVWSCVEYEEREGEFTELTWQLLEFDDEGWLRLVVGPNYAQYFDWQEGTNGKVLDGGVRLRTWSKTLQFLSSQAVVSALTP